MGRTPTPLTILVPPEWLAHPTFTTLVEKGHRVEALVTDADIVLGPTAHLFHERMLDGPYLDVAMKAARARRKSMKKETPK